MRIIVQGLSWGLLVALVRVLYRVPMCCMEQGSLVIGVDCMHGKGLSSFISLFHRVPMAMVVDVSLISGRRVSLEANLPASVQSLAERARRALGVGLGRLFSSSGNVLEGELQLGAAKLQTGDCLTLQVGTVRISGGLLCFAAILGNESVVTWGSAHHGGDSSSVQNKLEAVQQIQTTGYAFAAILGDGYVVTWGDPNRGGDSSSVQD